METETSFGALISRRRKALGLLQKELALQVGCSVTAVQKMERDVPRDLSRIQNDLDAVAVKQQALRDASTAAEQNAATLQQNLAGGVASQLEFRLAQNDSLEVKTALLSLAYQQHVDLAEWDRATGKYLRFVDENAQNVQ